MRSNLKIGVILAALGAASSVSANTQGEGTGDVAAAREVLSAVAGQPEDRRPLARLRSPLCLTVAATDEAFARTVAKRIIANARAAGIPTRSAGCRSNALVTFSDDPRAQIAEYRANDGKLFKRFSESKTDAVLEARDPALVFQTVQQTPRIGEGDARFGMDAGFGAYGGGEHWTKERSFLRTPEDLLTTVVMIDNAAIAGRGPVQLADYATLRLLAPTGEIDAAQTGAQSTILSLFTAPEAAPAEMTRADRTYLKTLYKLPRTAFASEVLAQTAASLDK